MSPLLLTKGRLPLKPKERLRLLSFRDMISERWLRTCTGFNWFRAFHPKAISTGESPTWDWILSVVSLWRFLLKPRHQRVSTVVCWAYTLFYQGLSIIWKPQISNAIMCHNRHLMLICISDGPPQWGGAVQWHAGEQTQYWIQHPLSGMNLGKLTFLWLF
jgi:hypothetical protein